MMQQLRIIRKYKNRKLYDTTNSRYVTLREIAQLLKQGLDIKVVDHQSEDDLTGMVLSEILYDQEKNHEGIIPVETLVNVIKSKGPSAFEFMKNFILMSLSDTSDKNAEALRYIEILIEQKKLTESEGKSLIKELSGCEKEAAKELNDQIFNKIDKQFDRAPGMEQIQTKIDELNQKIKDLEQKLQGS